MYKSLSYLCPLSQLLPVVGGGKVKKAILQAHPALLAELDRMKVMSPFRLLFLLLLLCACSMYSRISAGACGCDGTHRTAASRSSQSRCADI